MKRLFALVAVALIALAGFTSTAGAIITFNLGLGNGGISGFPGPYARVVVDRTTATTATITFQSFFDPQYIFLMGDGGSVAVNVNSKFWNLGPVTGINTGTNFTPGPWTNTGAGNEDGFGSFNQRIDSLDGYSHASDAITFQLTNLAGTWASDSDVLIANASGYRAAAHIFVARNPADGRRGDALSTGFATEGGTVPEPATMLLLGLGLAGFGAVRRRKKS